MTCPLVNQRIDPISKKFSKEEKIIEFFSMLLQKLISIFGILNRAYDIDRELDSKSFSVRQKWIDQAQSLDLFINL